MGRTSRRFVAPLGALAAVAFIIARARAETASARAVTLRWVAPSGCPDGSYVDAEIARLLAGSDAPARSLDVEAAVTPSTNGRWRVRLVTRSGGAGGDAGSASGSGERSLDAASCRALADASALIVAMAVDPARVAANQAVAAAEAARVESVFADAGIPGDASVSANALDGASDAAAVTIVPSSAPSIDLGERDSGSRPTPKTIDASVSDAEPPDAPETARAPRSSAEANASTAASPGSTVPPATFVAGAAIEADLGTLPNAGVAPMLFAAWTPGPWRIELAGAYFTKNHTAPLHGGGVGAFQLFSLDLRACYDLIAAPTRSAVSRFAFAPCVGAEVASMSGAGEGIQAPNAGSSAWVALLGGGLVAFRIADAWELDLRLDAAVPLLRPEFRIDASTVHRPAELTGRGMLGVGFRF